MGQIRRSKRTSAVLKSGVRRSKRKIEKKEVDDRIYSDDYGILPSDWSMVQASATKDVPLGYVCGYPLGRSGGELYGGSMFIKSAANDQPQGKAIHKINTRWSQSSDQYSKAFKNWEGRETIGIPVCKKKYSPFKFSMGPDGLQVTRMYGCQNHSHLRESLICKHGPRKGWEPFGQWSLQKAERLARKAIQADDSASSSSSSEEEKPTLKQICNNGRCTWKMKHKYDDVFEEIQERNNGIGWAEIVMKKPLFASGENHCKLGDLIALPEWFERFARLKNFRWQRHMQKESC